MCFPPLDFCSNCLLLYRTCRQIANGRNGFFTENRFYKSVWEKKIGPPQSGTAAQKGRPAGSSRSRKAAFAYAYFCPF
jgi:hypothetical protein